MVHPYFCLLGCRQVGILDCRRDLFSCCMGAWHWNLVWGILMNAASYAQFLLESRSLSDLYHMRSFPPEFSTGTCTLWNITERQRVEAIESVIAVLEKNDGHA